MIINTRSLREEKVSMGKNMGMNMKRRNKSSSPILAIPPTKNVNAGLAKSTRTVA